MNLISTRLTRILTVAIIFQFPVKAAEASDRIASASPLNGQRALASKQCITCHSIWGVGGKLGPDLATAGSEYSFQQMASMFWNHTPRMVNLLKQRGMDWPVLEEQEMADIISFIYYLKLLDRPGDPNRGRTLYEEKKCRACHGPLPGAKGTLSLHEFQSFVSPVYLAQAMWNAGPAMHESQNARGIAMPLFEGREMADLQAFIRGTRRSGSNRPTYLPMPDIARGDKIFRSKGCTRCHGSGRSGPDLSKQALRKSISEICGILWNHSFAMQEKMETGGVAVPQLQGNDLADLLAYIYFLHFSRDRGDPVRGQRAFTEKGCANCHASGEMKGARAPDLEAVSEGYDMLRLATSMWNHAPIMFETMEDEVMKWIKLDPDDMQDISAFLRHSGSGK